MRKSEKLRGDVSQEFISSDERNKVRNSIGKLIHTVQQIPSTRSRLDQLDPDSLGELIRYLESFNSMTSTKCIKVTKTTESKHYSKKYLNLRLCPSPERLKSKTPETSFSRTQTKKGIDSKKRKEYPQARKNSEDVESLDLQIQDKRKKSLYTFRDDKINSIKKKTHETNYNIHHKINKAVSKGSLVKSEAKRKSTNINRKDFTQNIDKGATTNKTKIVKTINFFGSPRNTEKTTRVSSRCEQDKLQLLNSKPKLKRKSELPAKINRSTSMTVCHQHYLAKSQPSKVKNLTCYWNSLLSNEQSSSVPDISEFYSSTTKSLEHLVNNEYKYVTNRPSTTTVSSRHHSELNMHILKDQNKDAPHLTFKNYTLNLAGPNDRDEKSDISTESHEADKQISFDYMKTKPLDDSSSGNVSSNPSSIEIINNIQETSQPIKVLTHSIQEPNLKTEHVIEVMQKLILILKVFPDTSMSDERLNLSRTVKTMLCLMSTKLMSLSELERSYDFSNNNRRKNKSTTTVSRSSESLLNQVSTSTLPPIIEERNIYSSECVESSSDNAIVPLNDINRRKVDLALKRLMMCKEYLWMMFIWNPNFFHHDHRNNMSSPTYGIIYEGQFVFENEIELSDSEDDSSDWNYDSLSTEFINDLYRNVLDNVTSELKKAALRLSEYWDKNVGDSFKTVLEQMYQLLVSALICWVIVKELLLE